MHVHRLYMYIDSYTTRKRVHDMKKRVPPRIDVLLYTSRTVNIQT